MIQRNELKVNNFVLVDWLKHDSTITKPEDNKVIKRSIVQVENIWNEGINLEIGYDGSKDFHPLQHCHGIPITPEILRAAGFEKDRTNLYQNYPVVETWRHGVVIITKEAGSYYSSPFDCEMKYLHEVQNLYFVAYQEELEITADQIVLHPELNFPQTSGFK